MLLIPVSWVHHSGGAIYSLDICPTAAKLATCGMDDAGGVLMVWNLVPMVSEKAFNDPANNPRVLAKIQHQAGVNAVRWSRSGKQLASACDDKAVTIWEYVGRVKSAGTIGKGAQKNVEMYKSVNHLHGHAMEVMSVEWSHNGRLLASGSMDDTVVVWNALKFPEKVVVLDLARGGHTSPVKGLSWDPIGKYLVSQGADKVLRFWTTDNWTCDYSITKPFEESSQCAMFARPDWSPDGQFMIAPCALNNEGPTAQIIKRKDWDHSLDFVGHRKTVTVARACPRMVRYTDAKGKVIDVSIIAIGSRDKSVSVWALPSLKRPLAVFSNVFKHSVMDLAWRDLTLIACSQDGTAMMFTFLESELGKLLSLQEVGDLCESLYGTRPIQYNNNENDQYATVRARDARKSTFIETVSDLVAERQKSGQVNGEGKENGHAEEAPEAETTATASTTTSALQNGVNGTSAVSENGTAEPTPAPTPPPPPPPPPPTKTQEEELLEARKKQLEMKTKEGKRRIQPIFLGSTMIEEAPPSLPTIPEPLPVPQADVVMEEEPARPASSHSSVSGSGDEPMEAEEAANQGPRITTKSYPKKRRDSQDDEQPGPSTKKRHAVSTTEDETEEEGEGETATDATTDDDDEPTRRDKLLRADFRRPTLRAIDRENGHIDTTHSMAIFAEPEMQTSVIEIVGTDVLLEASNDWREGPLRVPRVVCTRKGEQLWTILQPAEVVFLAANGEYVLMALSDRNLSIYAMQSGRQLTTLKMDSAIAKIGLERRRAYALTSHGNISAWNLSTMKSMFTKISVVDCVSPGTTLDSVSLTESGSPLLSFSNGNSYVYSLDLMAWQLVDSLTSLLRISEGAQPEELGANGIISRLIQNRKRPGPAPGVSLLARARAGEAALEQWMAAARTMRSYEDYRKCTLAYAQRLISNDSVVKLRELLKELDEPTTEDSAFTAVELSQLNNEVKALFSGNRKIANIPQEMEEEGNVLF